MAKKYIVEVTKGYETTITFSSILPTGEDIKNSEYSVPFTVTPGLRQHSTLAKAKAAVAEHIRNGGEARIVAQ